MKYDINDSYIDKWISTIDAQEELGSTLEIDRDEWSDIREDPLADLLGGTHCKRLRRDGNKCCSRQIYELIRDTLDEVNTSPVFNTSCETVGVVANVRFCVFRFQEMRI